VDVVKPRRVRQGIDPCIGFQKIAKPNYAAGRIAIFGEAVPPPISSIKPENAFLFRGLFLNLFLCPLRVLQEKLIVALENDYGVFSFALAIDTD